MKRTIIFFIAAVTGLVATQCGSNSQKSSNTTAADSSAKKIQTDTVVVFLGNNNKGVGRFRNIQLENPFNKEMAAKGKAIYLSKCFACHKLSSEILVGPGWADVTTRRSPEWIMNWVTNTKVMLDKDQAVQAEMAVCLIRMPSQDLTDDQARNVLEFMRQNDSPNK